MQRVNTTVIPPTTVSSIPADCPSPLRCKGNELLALGDCQPAFVQCTPGVAVQSPCAAGQFFDRDQSKCRPINDIAKCAVLPPVCKQGEKVAKGVCAREHVECVNVSCGESF